MEEEKFWTKTRLIILGAVVAIILIVVAIILIHRNTMRKKYIVLENQINNTAPNYLLYEKIELEEDEYRKIPIELIKAKGLVTNANIKDCEGYVIAKNIGDDITYKTYISCKGIYQTVGYGSQTTGNENRTATQTENDTEAPEIKLLGSENMYVALGEKFEDRGATAYDKVDGDLTKQIKVDGEIDINKIGEYMIIYSVKDKTGNEATKERKVIVKEGENQVEADTNPPVITFTNPNSYQKVCIGDRVDISANGVYGYTAYDDKDGNITGNVVVSGDINAQSRTGTYTINYSVFDQAKNATTASRTYSVVDCSPAPSNPTPSGGGNNGGGNSGGNGGTPSSSSSSSSEVIRPEVNITVNVTSINSVDSLTLNVGSGASLNASVLPSNATNKTLTYRSNNTSVATVDGNGYVRAVSRGETRVIITSSNNIQKAVYIIVK
jgi:uncharacterized protein YjdB